MTRKYDREKVKMKTDDGAFDKVLDMTDLGTVLQSGLGDKDVYQVHAPATLWMTAKIKATKDALVDVFNRERPIDDHSSLFATNVEWHTRTQSAHTLTRDVESV